MAEPKRLWTNEELWYVSETITRLRRMRTAATTEKPSLFLRINKALHGLVKSKEKLHDQQEALVDAGELANAAADYLAAKWTKVNTRAEEKKWKELLYDAEKQYGLYDMTTFARTGYKEVVGNSLIARLRNADIDPKYMFDWDLFVNNHCGESMRELLEGDTGVFSPLSGDYFMARFYSSYLRRKRGRTFEVQPVALSRDLSLLVLPEEEGIKPFDDKKRIALYIDTTETGSTARALYDGIRAAYPDKEVLQPRMKRVEFVRSKKIQKFWDRHEKATQR